LLPNKHENTALAAIFQFRLWLRVSDGPIDSPFSTFRLAGLTAITFSSSPDLPDEPKILRETGWDALHTGDIGLSQAADQEICF